MLYFFLCQNFLTTSFQETECCFRPHFNRGKTCFSRKIPQKVQLTKHLFFTWVSRNIFHLKHFFLDFYFHFFVFFLRSKTFFRVKLSGETTVFFPLGFTQSIDKYNFRRKRLIIYCVKKVLEGEKHFQGIFFKERKKIMCETE